MPSSTRLGMTRCEHCGRQFNPHSAARHIPWCQKQQSNSQRRKLSAEKQQALERYKWRISYRPSNGLAPRSVCGALGNGGKTHHTSSINSSSVALSSSTGGSSSASSLASNSQSQLARSGANNYNDVHNKVKVNNNNKGNTGKRGEQTRAEGRPSIGRRSVSSVSLVAGTSGRGIVRARAAQEQRTRQHDEQETVSNGDERASVSSRNSHASTRTITRSSYEQQSHVASLGPTRAKSSSDLANMNEVVEHLARKMELIYAQNKLLIESLAQHRKQAKQAAQNSDKQFQSAAAIAATGASDASNGERDTSARKCHHCHSLSMTREANYCHQCGCKMVPSAASQGGNKSSRTLEDQHQKSSTLSDSSSEG